MKKTIDGPNIHALSKSQNDYHDSTNKHLSEYEKASREEGTPELPEREYLEDIDFVCKEFDLFFKRKPELPARTSENKESTTAKNDGGFELEPVSDHQKKIATATVKESGPGPGVPQEESHYMSLRKIQEESSSSEYQSLTLISKEQPNAYRDTDVTKESTESHYQPLIFVKPSSKSQPTSEYQSLNVTTSSKT